MPKVPVLSLCLRCKVEWITTTKLSTGCLTLEKKSEKVPVLSLPALSIIEVSKYNFSPTFYLTIGHKLVQSFLVLQLCMAKERVMREKQFLYLPCCANNKAVSMRFLRIWRR